MRTGRTIALIMIVTVFVALLVGPTAVFAADDASLNQVATAALYQAEVASDDGSGFVLAFLAGIVALIITVVAIVGAVGLGLIGIGYASSNSGDE